MLLYFLSEFFCFLNDITLLFLSCLGSVYFVGLKVALTMPLGDCCWSAVVIFLFPRDCAFWTEETQGFLRNTFASYRTQAAHNFPWVESQLRWRGRGKVCGRMKRTNLLCLIVFQDMKQSPQKDLGDPEDSISSLPFPEAYKFTSCVILRLSTWWGPRV